MKHEDTTLWYWQVVTGFALFFLASVHLYIMLTRPDRIGPFESADRVWTDLMWPLYLVHAVRGGVPRRRRPVPAGAQVGLVRGRRPRCGRDPAQAAALQVGADRRSSCVLGLLTLAAYMKIGIEHAPFYGQHYVPAAAAATGVTP